MSALTILDLILSHFDGELDDCYWESRKIGLSPGSYPVGISMFPHPDEKVQYIIFFHKNYENNVVFLHRNDQRRTLVGRYPIHSLTFLDDLEIAMMRDAEADWAARADGVL